MGASWTPRKPWKVVRKKLDHFLMKILLSITILYRKKFQKGCLNVRKHTFSKVKVVVFNLLVNTKVK